MTGVPRGNYARALEAVTGQPIENLGFKGTDPARRQVLGVAGAAARGLGDTGVKGQGCAGPAHRHLAIEV